MQSTSEYGRVRSARANRGYYGPPQLPRKLVLGSRRSPAAALHGADRQPEPPDHWLAAHAARAPADAVYPLPTIGAST